MQQTEVHGLAGLGKATERDQVAGEAVVQGGGVVVRLGGEARGRGGEAVPGEMELLDRELQVQARRPGSLRRHGVVSQGEIDPPGEAPRSRVSALDQGTRLRGVLPREVLAPGPERMAQGGAREHGEGQAAPVRHNCPEALGLPVHRCPGRQGLVTAECGELVRPGHDQLLTRPSVLGSTTAYLRLFESDLIRRLTDSTTIDLAGLVAGKPMSLYIIVPPHRVRAYASILRLWLTGLMNLLTLREKPLTTPTLMLVDEAAQLGRVDSFVTAMTLMRGYSLKLWTFWQAVSQLEIYGTHARTIIDNAGVVQVFGVRNHRAATEIAKLLGGITPETLTAMGMDEQVLMIEGDGAPRVARQIRYYEEEELRSAASGRSQ